MARGFDIPREELDAGHEAWVERQERAAQADTPAPIATPEEVRAGQIVDRIVAEWVYFHGEADRQGLWDIATREVAAALTSSNAEIERVTRERDEETDAKLSYYSQIATLTDQVGRMREAAIRLVGAGLNEMAVKRLPLELSQHSALGAMLDVLGVPNDEAEKPAAEWDRLLRAALSPTEPDAWRRPMDDFDTLKAQKETIRAAEEAARQRWVPTHEHYKGGLYRVIARGRIEADLSPCVIYDDEAGNTWVRPADDFDQTDPFVRFAAIPRSDG